MSTVPQASEPMVARNQSFEYDLSKRLVLSDRTYIRELGDYHVAFNPDYPGDPILLSNAVTKLARSFSAGQPIGQALLEAGYSLDEGLPLVDYLYDRGFLRPQQNARRYSADDRLENPLSSMSMWVHINNHCNLDCSYCFVDKFKATMDEATILRTAAKIRSTVDKRHIRTLNVAYAGGEPTLSLEKIVQFSDALRDALDGTSVWRQEAILTNGTVVNQRMIDFVLERRMSIGISLDGYGSEFHDRHRVFTRSRRGSWDKIIKNIEILKSNGIRPYIMVVTSAETAESLPELIRWIGEQRLMMRLSVVRQPDGNWHPENYEAAFLRLTSTLIPHFERAFCEMEKPEYPYSWAKNIRLCELHFDNPSYSTSCGIGSSHVIVQEDGNLASCPMTIRERQVSPGDDLIFSTSQTVTVSPKVRNDSTEKNCLDCRWFPVCVSGCPVTNERVKGKPFTISPMHDFYEYVIPRFIDFQGRKLLQAADTVGATLDVIDPELIGEARLS